MSIFYNSTIYPPHAWVAFCLSCVDVSDTLSFQCSDFTNACNTSLPSGLVLDNSMQTVISQAEDLNNSNLPRSNVLSSFSTISSVGADAGTFTFGGTRSPACDAYTCNIETCAQVFHLAQADVQASSFFFEYVLATSNYTASETRQNILEFDVPKRYTLSFPPTATNAIYPVGCHLGSSSYWVERNRTSSS